MRDSVSAERWPTGYEGVGRSTYQAFPIACCLYDDVICAKSSPGAQAVSHR